MRKIILITILFFVSAAVKAQLGNQYSQVINNPELINPSYQGGIKGADVLLIYGERWSGFKGSPKTMGLNARYGFNKLVGVGFRADIEKMGHRTNTMVGANADVDIRLSGSSYLNFGLFLGAEMWRYSLADALAAEQGMIMENFDQNNPAGGVGLTFRRRGLYIGASSYMSFYKGDEKNMLNSYLHAEYTVNLPADFEVRPMVLFAYNNKTKNYWEAGAMAYYRKFLGLGASYRDNQGVNIYAQIEVLKSITLGASYGINTGELADLSRSSFEVSVGFKLFKD